MNAPYTAAAGRIRAFLEGTVQGGSRLRPYGLTCESVGARQDADAVVLVCYHVLRYICLRNIGVRSYTTFRV